MPATRKPLKDQWPKVLAIALVILALVLISDLRGSHKPQTSSAAISHHYPTSKCFTAAQSWNEIGQTGCVQFLVGYTYVSAAGNAYLDQYADYSTGFGVWIPAGYSFGSADTAKYAYQTIDVTGVITSYDGAPQIEVTDSSQIHSAG